MYTLLAMLLDSQSRLSYKPSYKQTEISNQEVTAAETSTETKRDGDWVYLRRNEDDDNVRSDPASSSRRPQLNPFY
jgi:uncharacterized protein YchJ